MIDNFYNLQKCTKIEICNINDIDEIGRHVNFFMGNKKVEFRDIVLKICYDEDIPIDNNLRMYRRINNFINKMRRNIKVSLSI